MSQNTKERETGKAPKKPVLTNEFTRPVRRVMPLVVIVLVLLIFGAYFMMQKEVNTGKVEAITSQMVHHLASDISNEMNYAKSSITAVSLSVEQTMTSDTLEDPSKVINPLMKSTPFGGIEYIRPDGMNVMNIGEPFDASDRIYYIEGIKGKTGVWNNFHPKTSKETLMNFYTPLYYNDKIAGVITGYIGASSQIAPILDTKIEGQNVYEILLDENDMVICSTNASEFVKDFSVDMYLEDFQATKAQKQKMKEILKHPTKSAVAFKDPEGEGRIHVSAVPNTNWRVAVIVPSKSFNTIVNQNGENAIIAMGMITLILCIYAAYVLITNVNRRKEIAKVNEKLEEANRVFNEENERAFTEISEIRDIIASAEMGTWRIELVDGEEPRMYVDDTMRMLLGVEGEEARLRTPEQTYTDWFSNIKPEAVPSVLRSVESMQQGNFDENTYLWMHPSKGIRYVRCGGTAQEIPGGYCLRGYHYDVDEVVRKEQEQMILLRDAMDANREYYSTLEALSDIFYSMHVIDLKNDSVVAFSARNEVKDIVNQKNGVVDMMRCIINKTITEPYLETAQNFTDLTTIADRMKDKIIVSCQLIGKNVGWLLASFISMEKDEDGKPTKVIFTTRIIDEEKKQEEKLIYKSQTDELSGLLNRRAYEEDAHRVKEVFGDKFTYISLDANGLKQINDSLGHTAGDELIVGASQCMRKCFGSYGKVYRVGGDEFVAILFCDSEHAKPVLEDFEETVEQWSGDLIDSISISYGAICNMESPEASIEELAIEADKRMYANKEAYYRNAGVDRKGQKAAHKALCDLYTKILKINIQEDTYQIINMDIKEQDTEKGFADTISQWFISFGETGHVHPEDLEEYLRLTDLNYMREYFAGNNTSLNVFYRRKYEDGFKKVMMEIIPVDKAEKNPANLFLYVKNIEM